MPGLRLDLSGRPGAIPAPQNCSPVAEPTIHVPYSRPRLAEIFPQGPATQRHPRTCMLYFRLLLNTDNRKLRTTNY